MNNLMSLTILEQVRIVTPYVFTAISFSLFIWLMCYITEIRVNRKWLRDPANMKRTVQDHLKRRDDIIKELRAKNAGLQSDNEKMAAVIHSVRSRLI